MTIQDLPALNAVLNGVSALLLTAGFLCVRTRHLLAHMRCMLAALVVSTLFLVSYLTYHYHHGSTPFRGQGTVRGVYFTILISHTFLAVVNVPLVVTTVTFALRGRFDRHKPWARITLPIWWYVSVTGVVIYWMLYHGHFGES